MQTAELITDSLEGVVENEAFFHKIAAVVHVRVVLAFNREPADLPTTLPFRVLSHEDKRGAQEDSVRIFEVIQHLVRNEEVSLG